MERLDLVGVVGCGLMGAGIAEVCARAGKNVVVVEESRAGALAGQKRIEASLERAELRGKISSARQVQDRIQVVSDLEALGDRQIVVEAIVEDEAAKLAIFSRLDKVISTSDAILATNTSSIPVMNLAVATHRSDRVIGLHFFNPVPVLHLVEVVPSLLTSPETVAQVRAFATDDLGKHAIDSQDRAGFVVNALLIPFILSAIRMLESGFATAEISTKGWCAARLTPKVRWHWPI